MRRPRPQAWRGILGAAALALAVAVVALVSGVHPPRPPGPTPTPAPPRPSAPPRPNLPGPSPGARMLAATAVLDGRTVLFGGLPQTGPPEALGDTWVFDGQRWALQHVAVAPSPRSGAVLSADGTPGGRLVLAGGDHGTGETWSWDGRAWHRLPDSLPAGVHPRLMAPLPAPAGVLMVAETDAGARSTWRLAGDTWTEVAGPEMPEIRLLALDPGRGRVLGLSRSLTTGPGPADTWAFENGRWTALTVGVGPVDVELITAVMTADLATSSIVLAEEDFRDPAGDRGGTWTWGGARWVRRTGLVPSTVHGFGVTQPVWAVIGGRLALIGGPNVGETYRDAWTWDGIVWTRPSGG